ncbi:hypothetical protein DL766_004257 [Monosporascus sp. MC13-8B]|uniref:F-box domain-containing protein n=1 Tax=Monosporascus cannonballus TaxID=155416 RepID=A0ABY0HCU8_9PEZI|nr:hypothetical protein DL762_002667 [Monosporascus cannonballus]RYO95430.1 hypothetical protein DL763_003694 [Monosporascus cannonballus]RYP31778.1 hypothetical protein DL766_004257 [Monosporascus sp. MC13-8B]
MGTLDKLQSLPEEIILHIMSFLLYEEIVKLQSVSKFFLRICRDGNFWRNRCLSGYVLREQMRDHPNRIAWSVLENSPLLSSKERGREHTRLTANWDPTFPDEKVNWYDEYIQRNAPIAVSWFQLPHTRDGPTRIPIDVRGCALYQGSSTSRGVLAVSPLDDDASRRSKRIDSGVVECVSIDNQRNRAFFAVQNHLVEVDLETTAIVRDQTYEWSINTLSTIQPAVPLTVGTTLGLHLHDHRSPSRSLPLYAPLAQPSPLSVLHLERAGHQDQVSDDIFVAGRFSNILHYDRRMFPSIRGSIHSGAKLCAMTSLPYPFSCINTELRRDFQLSEEQVTKAKNEPGRTLVACGEYNTKGSLEMYGLSAETCGEGNPRAFRKSAMKNRQTASRSKLLSVINHGTRIVYSDGQGYLKWVERDGVTEVRRHKIGLSERVAHRSLFGSMPGSDEIALKILSTKSGQNGNESINDDDLLFWTGERLGVVGFSSKPGFFADELEDDTRTPEEIAAEKEQELYGEKMRLALERHARDVHFVHNLGAGSIRTRARNRSHRQ